MVSALEHKLREVILGMEEELKTHGFKRSGKVFRRINGGNCGLIEFQRSVTSSPQNLVFTINLGVVCGQLLDVNRQNLSQMRFVDAHVSERLGMLAPERTDKWWEISAESEAEKLLEEIMPLVLGFGVPYLSVYLETSAIVSLWRSGKSPGLTEGQRKRFLARLTGECCR